MRVDIELDIPKYEVVQGFSNQIASLQVRQGAVATAKGDDIYFVQGK